LDLWKVVLPALLDQQFHWLPYPPFPLRPFFAHFICAWIEGWVVSVLKSERWIWLLSMCTVYSPVVWLGCRLTVGLCARQLLRPMSGSLVNESPAPCVCCVTFAAVVGVFQAECLDLHHSSCPSTRCACECVATLDACLQYLD
jgi:hypothetical protein